MDAAISSGPAKNPDEAKKLVDEFDHWKKTRTFKDHDLAAELHLAGGLILLAARPDLRKEAAEKCKEGLAFDPHDPDLRACSQQFSQALTGEPANVIPVGSGTGFCIAQGNYVLTNHHVIARRQGDQGPPQWRPGEVSGQIDRRQRERATWPS